MGVASFPEPREDTKISHVRGPHSGALLTKLGLPCLGFDARLLGPDVDRFEVCN